MFPCKYLDTHVTATTDSEISFGLNAQGDTSRDIRSRLGPEHASRVQQLGVGPECLDFVLVYLIAGIESLARKPDFQSSATSRVSGGGGSGGAGRLYEGAVEAKGREQLANGRGKHSDKRMSGVEV